MKKKIGFGSLSVVLAMAALGWSYNIDGYCFGDKVLKTMNMPYWSDMTTLTGLHYTAYYSFFLLIPAFILSIKYKNDFMARLGRWYTIWLAAVLISGLLVFN